MENEVINENKPWLQVRIRNCEIYEGGEQVYGHFLKSRRGYFLNAFFGKNFWKFMLLSAFAVILYFTGDAIIREEEFTIYHYAMFFFMGIGPFCWLIDVAIKTWFWKYSKHVIVSDKGIWIMIFSTLWWSKAYDGKKHMFSASWSFYEWGVLSGVFPEQSRISKICDLSDFVMCRWDGNETVRYLKSDDVDEVEKYAKLHIPAKKWTKKRPVKRKFSIFDFMR